MLKNEVFKVDLNETVRVTKNNTQFDILNRKSYNRNYLILILAMRYYFKTIAFQKWK